MLRTRTVFLVSRTERACVAVVFVDVLFSDDDIGADRVSDVTRFGIHRMSFFMVLRFERLISGPELDPKRLGI